jgi:hypothetical protein
VGINKSLDARFRKCFKPRRRGVLLVSVTSILKTENADADLLPPRFRRRSVLKEPGYFDL